MTLPPQKTPPKGDSLSTSKKIQMKPLEVDTFDGKVHVEWDPAAAVTPIG